MPDVPTTPESPEEPAAAGLNATEAPPAVDAQFRRRHLPGTPAGEAKGMLPGMAMIAMYLLFISMFTAFKVARAYELPTYSRYAILAVSTFIVIGAFGLLRLKRWGWALVAGGCLTMAAGNFYAFHRTHIGPYMIQGLFALLFFLYLSRTEVRERLR